MPLFAAGVLVLGLYYLLEDEWWKFVLCAAITVVLLWPFHREPAPATKCKVDRTEQTTIVTCGPTA